MPYDYPYRLIKTVNVHTNEVAYVVEKASLGIICEGSDHYEMRKLVDIANVACQVDKTIKSVPKKFEKGIAKF
jgi:hypothetical protein